jgi:DNA-binding CsgD family transcriptional regulator/GAF domain-containing protein
VGTVARSRADFWRVQDIGAFWNKPHSSLSVPDLQEVVGEVLRAAQMLLESDTELLAEGTFNSANAKAALSAIWRRTDEALRGNVLSAEAVINTSAILDLLDRVREVDSCLQDSCLARRDNAFKVARSALARLGHTSSVAALIDQVLPSVCELGFDRVILSRIRDCSWTVEAMCVPTDPQWASEIVCVGREHPQPLIPMLCESEIVRRKTPIIVSDVQRSQNVHRQIAEASLARSYVAAPIMSQEQVIGFLHGDCYFQRRHVDQFDRDVLSAFAELFGYLLERNVLHGQLQALRTDLRGMSDRISFGLDDVVISDALGTPGVEEASRLSHTPSTWGRGPMSRFAMVAQNSPLTRRELDVVQLMAAGETNRRIASRLVLSEGTVKTHVKHILRKLRVANRAEAVSRWLHIASTLQADDFDRMS